MRYLAVNGSILGMLLLAATPAGAQSMADLGAAMGINGALNGAGASSANTALRARETIMSHTPSGNGGWVDGGDARGPASGSGKGWSTATSGSTAQSGKGGWATAGSSARGTGTGTGGWATASANGGKGGWASRNDPGSATPRR